MISRKLTTQLTKPNLPPEPSVIAVCSISTLSVYSAPEVTDISPTNTGLRILSFSTWVPLASQCASMAGCERNVSWTECNNSIINFNGVNHLKSNFICLQWLWGRISPWHNGRLHIWLSEFVDPAAVQWSPPYFGSGFVQSRVRVRIPFPQVAEHEPHANQSAQDPCTDEKIIIESIQSYNLIFNGQNVAIIFDNK